MSFKLMYGDGNVKSLMTIFAPLVRICIKVQDSTGVDGEAVVKFIYLFF